jgi:copper resistance protein B
MRNETMTTNQIRIRIRPTVYPIAITLVLLSSSSWAVAQSNEPATVSSTPTVSQPMMMGHDAPMQGMAQAVEMDTMQNMAGMDMKHEQAVSKAPPIGSLPTSDGAAPNDYDAYGVNLRIHDDPLLAKVQLDNLESAYSSGGVNSQLWDGRFWIGHNLDKLWVRSEGSRSKGKIEEGDVETLWGHAISPFWNLMAGMRHDFGTRPTRNWAAFGLQGIAPYEFEFEATVYAGPSGRSALRIKTAQDWLLTQKLILTPELDMNAYGRADPQRSLGAGLSDASLTFRLRYEFSRKFAPYIGCGWARKFGATGDMARTAGQSVSDQQILLGVRLWF